MWIMNNLRIIFRIKKWEALCLIVVSDVHIVLKLLIFKERLEVAMLTWQRVRQYQGEVDTLLWWEKMVKPGVRKLGIERSKEINKEREKNSTFSY